jgi:phosphatidylinositol alpha-mannosyltransferase
MASGAPLVASDLPAFRALLQADRRDVTGGLGTIFPAGDHRALASAVTAVLDRPDAGQVARARQHAQRYDWAGIGPELVEIYRGLAGPLVRLAGADPAAAPAGVVTGHTSARRRAGASTTTSLAG